MRKITFPCIMRYFLRRKFKHVETEILPNISNHDCLYEVYDDEYLMIITYASVDEDDKDESDSEYSMLDPAFLDLGMPVQDNIDSSIRPALATT